MSLKTRVRRLLTESDRQGLIELLLEDRRVVPALNRLLFDEDELIRWRAVTALGWVAAEDPFLLEKIISRLFYTMNDDSGSIGWTAPQALGEICAIDPDLVEDYFGIVITAMDKRVFRTGAVWAVGRVAPVRPDLVEETGPILARYLTDPDPKVRGLACWALERVGWTPARKELKRLVSDQGRLLVYEDDRLVERTVGRMASAALSSLSRREEAH